MTKRGKLFIIDGTDASGKKTQTELLERHLKDAGFKVMVVDFPQYGNKSCGLVEEYLSGKYGKADEVSPYVSSIFYAADRFDAAKKMHQALEDGVMIVSNRYVSANKGHQGGKMKTSQERDAFLTWLDKLEYEIFQIPKPDKVFFLHVPIEIGQKLLSGRGGAKDIHEEDVDHLKQTEQAYLEMVERYTNWTKISCIKEGEMRTREDIAGELFSLVEKEIYTAA